MKRRRTLVRRGSTLAEVARAAGVSVATASRVLNGANKESGVGSAARAAKIRQLAEKLAYRPDWRARALRTQRSSFIGVVYSQVNPMMDMTSYGRMFRTFGEVLEAAGYHLMFVHVSADTGAQAASILQAVDAAVFYHRITDGQIEAAKAVRGPSILINCEPKLPFPSVNPDEAGGAAALTQHLLGLGHRRVAFVQNWRPGADYDHHSREVRCATLRKGMTRANLASGFQLWESDITVPFHDVVARWRRLPISRRPSALVVPYSIQALFLLNELVRQGVRVPDEVSVATFDDHAIVAQAIVPMTTVNVPMEDMGRTAAGLILRLLQGSGRPVPESVVLPEQLVVRQSTGSAP